MVDRERVEAYIERGRQRIEAALAAAPYRPTPHFSDLITACEAMLRHLIHDDPNTPLPEAEPVPQGEPAADASAMPSESLPPTELPPSIDFAGDAPPPDTPAP